MGEYPFRWSKTDRAIIQSLQVAARVRGMKIRASLNPPTAAIGFPWAHRTCAEWEMTESGRVIEMTGLERALDAKLGSTKLRDAIKAVAR